jgi:hypothetical protein
LKVNVQQGNFKILQLFLQVLILFLVEKWIPPSRSETAELVQKTEGILGVKSCYGGLHFHPKMNNWYRSDNFGYSIRFGCSYLICKNWMQRLDMGLYVKSGCEA